MNTFRLRGASGTVINQSFPLGETLTVGTEPGCDVQVEAPAGGATGVLATVSVSGEGGVHLSAPPDAGVTVNGDAVTERALAGGDELRVGLDRFILQAPGLRPERVLTGDAVRPRSARWPWWLAAALLAAGGAAAAWWQGWIVL